MNLTNELFQCALPKFVADIVNATTTLNTKELPRALMEGYFNCNGFTRSLLKANWSRELLEFPALIAIICISVIMSLLGLAWFIYEFKHMRVYRAENRIEKVLRLTLSITLFCLVFPYILFLSLAFTSFSSGETVHIGSDAVRSEDLRLSGVFEKYTQAAKLQPLAEEHLKEEVKGFLKYFNKSYIYVVLATNLQYSAPKVVQKGERSLLAKLSIKSGDIKQSIQETQGELDNLKAYVMQLNDFSRLFYRNTTISLDLTNISYKDYTSLIFDVFEANEQQILMLLNTNNILNKILEVIDFASTMNDMRQNLTSKMHNEFAVLEKYLNETVLNKALEYSNFDTNLTKELRNLQQRMPRNSEFFLLPNVNHLEITFCVIALILLLLVCTSLVCSLFYAWNRTLNRYLLMSIIATISVCLILLCLFAIWPYLNGVVYYNYRRELYENAEFCAAPTLDYCSLRSRAETMLDDNFENYLKTALENHSNQSVQHLCGDILACAENKNHKFWAKHLDEEVNFLDEIYHAGAMFDIVKQELNLEMWYELYNLLYEHSATESVAAQRESKWHMLTCHINIIRIYIFDQLFKHGIVGSLNKLAQQSTVLRAHLPGNNLAKLFKRVLREAQDLSDFCHTLKHVIKEKITNLTQLFTVEAVDYAASKFTLLPHCKDLRFIQLGISREMYECIEHSLHGYYIGAFGILILLYIIQIICIWLAIINEKQPAIGAVRTSSLIRMRSLEFGQQRGKKRSKAYSSGTESSRVYSKRPSHVTFQEPLPKND